MLSWFWWRFLRVDKPVAKKFYWEERKMYPPQPPKKKKKSALWFTFEDSCSRRSWADFDKKNYCRKRNKIILCNSTSLVKRIKFQSCWFQYEFPANRGRVFQTKKMYKVEVRIVKKYFCKKACLQRKFMSNSLEMSLRLVIQHGEEMGCWI